MNTKFKQAGRKAGFTLIELLVVVVIIGVLSSIALPSYMRSVEKARATDALVTLKAINDASLVFMNEKNACGLDFTKLVVSIPGTLSDANQTLTAKNFVYRLGAATNATLAGSLCPSATATRSTGEYVIWNPYIRGASGARRAMACYSPTNSRVGIGVCKSLDMFSATAPY